MTRLVNWFRRRSLERSLDRELQYHYDRRVADLTAAGIPEPEARRRPAGLILGQLAVCRPSALGHRLGIQAPFRGLISRSISWSCLEHIDS